MIQYKQCIILFSAMCFSLSVLAGGTKIIEAGQSKSYVNWDRPNDKTVMGARDLMTPKGGGKSRSFYKDDHFAGRWKSGRVKRGTISMAKDTFLSLDKNQNQKSRTVNKTITTEEATISTTRKAEGGQVTISKTLKKTNTTPQTITKTLNPKQKSPNS